MEIKTLLHILRNPYGFSEARVREARLEAADFIERVSRLATEVVERKIL